MKTPQQNEPPPNAWFIAVRAKDNNEVFGDIVQDAMKLSPVGVIASRCWKEQSHYFGEIRIDDYVMLPDQLLGIVRMLGVTQTTDISMSGRIQFREAALLETIIHGYKKSVQGRCHENGFPEFKWHRGFYVREIPNEQSIIAVRQSLATCVASWRLRKGVLTDIESLLENRETNRQLEFE
jgi:hypothetical protein